MKVLKIFGIVIGCLLGLCVVGLFVLGSLAPETYVYTGKQVPSKYVKIIRSLNLLEADEQIKYFYTDAMIDIKEGLYFVTDRNLMLYSNTWDEPTSIVAFDEIALIDAEYDDSFFGDSYVFVETKNGMELVFPVSSERGLDKKFVQYLEEMSGVEKLEDVSPQVESGKVRKKPRTAEGL